jgi:AraC family transcriptional regulator of adaptative response / DNA-3-methyladenine glycosylase II
VLTSLLARVRSQFDLDANPAVIEAHLGQDSLLARQICLAPGMRVPGAFDAFELAVRAVLGQQVSVAGATTLSGRLASSFGDFVATPFAKVMLHFPSATRLALAPCETIAQIGLPKTRAQTICNLARFSEGGGLVIAPGASLGATVAHLKTVGGIGEWTAQYIAMRALRFADAFPAGDLGLQKAAAQEPGESGAGARLNEKRLLARAAGWTPWRAYAALMLWHSLVKPN